jgi:DNA (cytosine-5)-methyltransferase 1
MPFFQRRKVITGTIHFFDLFSGIGGFREGLTRAGGFVCVGHCETDAYADRNYRALFETEGEWFCDDATKIETGGMPDFDLLCAGFPCQAFSIAGKRRGFEDARGTLFFEVARLAAEKRPPYLLLENVPGLLSHDKGRTFYTILGTLSELGYHVEWKVLNSKDFGVPQSRKRVYIVGYLDGRCAGKILPFPEANGAALVQVLAGSQGKRIYSAGGVSCTLTSQAGGMGGKTGLYEVGVPIKENTKKGYKVAYPGDSIDLGYPTQNSRRGRVGHEIAHTLTTGSQQGTLHFVDLSLKETGPRAILTPQKEKARQNGRRMKDPEEPMFTITATDRHGVIYHGRIRRLMPRECFRLQGYHDSQIDRMIKETSDSQLYKQAGNGVTVNVVEAIGRNIRSVDEELKKTDSGKGGDILSI